jgi:hypothetical protein
MSEAKPTPGLLHNGQVFALNAKHGWFEYGDAQSDVSRAFAADAIAEYERVRDEATAICVQTGLTPSQLVERVKELEELLNGVLLMDRMYSGRIVIEGWQEEVLRAALSKARPNTAEGE